VTIIIQTTTLENLKLLNREMTIAKTDGNISAGFETDSKMWRGYTNYIDVPSPY
jgi:hypothetical protein